MLDKHLDEALAQLIREWNIAEERIKKAEHVRANEVVSSAIFELRYAGRKLIDAIDLILREQDISKNETTYRRVSAYIADATEDCVKAKHDSIDSMMSFVTIWFKLIEDQLGLDSLQHFFPDFLKITASIAGIQKKIEVSRKDRITARDSTYDEIDQGPYNDILALYDRMRLSNDRVEAAVKKQRRDKRIHMWAAVGGAVLALVGLIGVVDVVRKLFIDP